MKRIKGAPKSRLGCQKCKDRRIKCDEVKPECGPCLRIGFACPGPSHVFKWSRKHELGAQPGSNSTTTTTTPSHQMQNGSAKNFNPLTETVSRPPPRWSGPRSIGGVALDDPDWLMEPSIGDELGADIAYQDAAALLFQDFETESLSGLFSISSPGLTTGEGTMQTTKELNSILPSPPESAGGPTDGGNTNLSSSLITTTTAESDAQSSFAASKSLLHTYYRLSSPPRSTRQVSSDKLIAYYLKHVARLHTCFDSDKNTFRTLTLTHLDTSGTLSLIIQSMAIAHLTNHYPYMAALGMSKRHQAWRALQKDLEIFKTGSIELNPMLLCLFLIGISSSWLHDKHAGLQYLHVIRTIIQSKLQTGTLELETNGLGGFWAGALVYWEMLACLIDPVPVAILEEDDLPDLVVSPLDTPVMPHPSTGLVPELIFAFAEICRLSRRCWSNTLGHESESVLSTTDRKWLQCLETFLLSIVIPEESRVCEIEDGATSKMDLVKMAIVYKNAGLLEIYRLNPDLLQSSLKEGHLDDLLVQFSNDGDSDLDIQNSLAEYAHEILNIIDSIYLSSGSCRLQPIILLCLSSHFRLQKQETVSALINDEITQRRYRIEVRLLGLSRRMPQTPILRAIDVVKEVWKRIDNGQNAQCWSVMYDQEWQTVLG